MEQTAKQDFTASKGMGYFLLPAVSAIRDVLCAPVQTAALAPALPYDTPAKVRDFRFASSYAKWDWKSREWDGGFGRQVLGETWINHHGAHGSEATRGILALLGELSDGDES